MKKKTFVKVLSLALAALMLFALCACGAAETPAAEPTAAPAADAPASEAPAETEAPAESQGVLDQIKADGVLYVTLSPDFAPMEFVDSSKDGQEQYVGFDVTLAKYIADYIGVDLVIEPMSFDACQTAVYTGSVPMSISGYSWTEERGENYEISDYYTPAITRPSRSSSSKRPTPTSTPPPRTSPAWMSARRTPRSR